MNKEGRSQLRLTLLGTGNPTPSLKRMGSGYILEVCDDIIALDHGPGAHHRLLEKGNSATDITHMMFSHLHYDHCLDFPRLALTRWDHGAGKLPDLKVFGPKDTKAYVDRLFGKDGAYHFDIVARCEHPSSQNVYSTRGGVLPRVPMNIDVTEYEHGKVIETDAWKLSIAEVPHAQPYLTCLALRFDADDGSIVYSGDSGPSENLVDLAKGCDVLIHMCCYYSGSVSNKALLKGNAGHLEAARSARSAEAKSLVVSHIYEQFDLPGVREKMVKEMAEVFDGTIIIGEDLAEIQLKPYELKRFS